LPESPIIPDICDLPVVKHLFGDGLRLAIQAERRQIWRGLSAPRDATKRSNSTAEDRYPTNGSSRKGLTRKVAQAAAKNRG
jgi:hypothetical protein